MASGAKMTGSKQMRGNVTPTPFNATNLMDHFDHIADDYYTIVDAIWYDVGYYHKKEASFLSRHVKASPRLALDAGCGPGRHTLTLASMCERVIAVDISRRMLQSTRAKTSIRLPNRVDLVQADVTKLPFRTGTFDFVLNLEVLEHLPGGNKDVLAACREFRRILRPGGLLVTEAPLRRHKLWRYVVNAAPSWKEISKSAKLEYYQRFPLAIQNTYATEEIEASLVHASFRRRDRAFFRVIPAGLVERYPFLTHLDGLLEKIPLVNRIAREAVWLAQVSA